MTHDTHDSTQDMVPDLESVLQVEAEDNHVIAVKVCEPVDVRELPTGRISLRAMFVSTAVGTKLLSDDPRRKKASIIAKTNDIRIGSTQAASTLTGVWVPNGQQLTVTASGELWACGTVDNTEVSVIEEYWA